ncbi:unnamed protein product, partial [Ectocarpus fasciculatus]
LLIAVIVYSFVWSVLCNNVSKVDQIWSVTPVMYSWMFWLHYYFNHEGVAHIRLTVVTVMVSVWGARLTYNFWRKGGYGNLITHEEDYRWPILREMMHPAVFFFFNLTFIATYQNVLLYLIALPTYFVMKGPSTTFTVFDLIVSCTFISLLAMETVADEQHFQFQAKKYSFPSTVRKTHPDKDVRDGFFQSGLWKFSRHPNYFAEQMMWVCVYLFSIPTTRNLLHFCSIGCVLLILLFQGSIAFGESITKSKYPSYELYQRKVSRCIPVCW